MGSRTKARMSSYVHVLTILVRGIQFWPIPTCSKLSQLCLSRRARLETCLPCHHACSTPQCDMKVYYFEVGQQKGGNMRTQCEIMSARFTCQQDSCVNAVPLLWQNPHVPRTPNWRDQILHVFSGVTVRTSLQRLWWSSIDLLSNWTFSREMTSCLDHSAASIFCFGS